MAKRKARQEKGLCYNCDEKYLPEHACKGRLFRLSVDGEELWKVLDESNDEDVLYNGE